MINIDTRGLHQCPQDRLRTVNTKAAQGLLLMQYKFKLITSQLDRIYYHKTGSLHLG